MIIYTAKSVAISISEDILVWSIKSTSKLFARRLFGGRVSTERARLRDCCKITEPVQEGSTADSQLSIDEEQLLEFDKEVIGKLYNSGACGAY